jgi:uncharacterized protein with ParB-like and HNH nuclease domain
MAQAVSSVKELVGMIERGEIRLPEMQRRYVWRATRVRDLLDSLYRGYPSGAILLWETDMEVPERQFAVAQQASPYSSNKLLIGWTAKADQSFVSYSRRANPSQRA